MVNQAGGLIQVQNKPAFGMLFGDHFPRLVLSVFAQMLAHTKGRSGGCISHLGLYATAQTELCVRLWLCFHPCALDNLLQILV